MTNEPKLKPKKMTYTRLDYPSELEKARMVGWNNCCDDWEEYLRQKIDVGEIEKIIGTTFFKNWEHNYETKVKEVAKALAEHFEGK